MTNSPSFVVMLQHTNPGYVVQAVAPNGTRRVSHRINTSPPTTGHPRDHISGWVQAAIPEQLAPGAAARRYGASLYDWLFPGPVHELLQWVLLSLLPNQALRVVLDLPPELAVIPWELLYGPDLQFMALNARISLVRLLSGPNIGSTQLQLLPATPPAQLQILFIGASPAQTVAIPLERELQQIQTGFQALIAQQRVVLEVVQAHDTYNRLPIDSNRAFDIVHVICHSSINQYGQTCLLFADSQGDSHPVAPEQLVTKLNQQRLPPKVLILNACRGALDDQFDPFSAPAALAAQSGIATVIATQFDLPIEVSASFTYGFYTAIANGASVEAAVQSARIRLFGQDNHSQHWAIPSVLAWLELPALCLPARSAPRYELPAGVHLSELLPRFSPSAQQNPEAVSSSFVDLGLLAAIAGSAKTPESVIVYGSPGSGKTSHRIMVAQAHRGVLVIELTDFTPLINHLLAGGEQLEKLYCELLGRAVLQELPRAPEYGLLCEAVWRDPILADELWAIQARSRLEPALAVLADYQPAHPVQLQQRYQRMSLLEWLRRLVALVKQAGYQSLMVVIDNLDNDLRIANDDIQQYNLIQPLFSNLAIMLESGCAFKLFLPRSLERQISRLAMHVRIQRFMLDTLLQSDKILEKMLNIRVSQQELTASGNTLPARSLVTGFADLCEPDIGAAVVQRMLTAAQSSPRRLMEIVRVVLMHHLRQTIDDPCAIGWAAVEAGLQALAQEEGTA